MDSGMIPEIYLPAVKALARFYLEDLNAEQIVDWVFFRLQMKYFRVQEQVSSG
jgi:hypothetical protein